MKSSKNLFIHCAVVSLGILFSGNIRAQTIPAANWINSAGLNAAQVLNTNGVFVTNFKATNDLTVRNLSGAADLVLVVDDFGGSNPGNNPAYLAQFVGAATNGTGDGTAGGVRDLDMTVGSHGDDAI